MTFAHRTGDGVDSLSFNQLADGMRGNGIVIDHSDLPSPVDCEPSLSDSTSNIIIDVAAGVAMIDGSEHGVATSSAQLSDGSSTAPRRDVVYVAEGGSVEVLEGETGAPATDGSGTVLRGASAPLPEAPDMADVTGVPVAVVWIPAGASSSDDLDPARDVWDRRVPVPPSPDPSLQSQTIPVSELAAGDIRTVYVPLQPGSKLRLYKWGLRKFNNATDDNWEPTSPENGLSVELVGPSGDVIASSNAVIEMGDPIFEANSDGSLSTVADYYFRIRNQTGSDINAPSGLTAYVEYSVVEP